jgi:predicted component of type VI protein secretion system
MDELRPLMGCAPGNCEIMYAPEFQQLEATWRGLHYLVHHTETSTMLRLRVRNVSKNDRKRSPT